MLHNHLGSLLRFRFKGFPSGDLNAVGLRWGQPDDTEVQARTSERGPRLRGQGSLLGGGHLASPASGLAGMETLEA